MPEDQTDDLSIPNSDRLFRRVVAKQLYTEPDGSQRPTSAVFKNPELSVNIESLMVAQGRPPEDCLANFPADFLTSITAGGVRIIRTSNRQRYRASTRSGTWSRLGQENGFFRQCDGPQPDMDRCSPEEVAARIHLAALGGLFTDRIAKAESSTWQWSSQWASS
jgi:hypothetical protein